MAKRRIEEALREPHDGHPDDTGRGGLNVAQVQAGEEVRKALAQFDRETILGILRDVLAEGGADDDDAASLRGAYWAQPAAVSRDKP